MNEQQPPLAAVSPLPDEGAGGSAAHGQPGDKKRKKRDKVRSAWISFVGRILAQFVGAAASIMLGLMVLEKYQAMNAAAQPPDREIPTTASVNDDVSSPVRVDRGLLSVAVLPLQSLSESTGREAVADAITEALIAELSRMEGLRVVSRTSAMHYRQAQKPMPDIARQLGVRWIVEGSVVTAGQRARVISQLIDGATDEHVWAATYDRSFADLLSLQTALAPELARDIARVIVQQQRLASAAVHPGAGTTTGAGADASFNGE